MTAIPTSPIPCPGSKPKRTHRPTYLSAFCGDGPNHAHGHCPGSYTHPCGCTVPCRCTRPGHPEDRPHPYQETPVLPDPFTVPDPDVVQNTTTNEAPLGDAVADWVDRIEGRQRPWVDGTGAPQAPLEVMVRAFAMAAGDLHLNSDPYEDYDETALVAMLGILRAAVRRAGELDALLVKHLWDHYPHGKHHLHDVGEVNTHRRDARVNWDDYGTAEAWVAQKMEEREGVLPDDPMDVVRWLLEVASIGYFRKTPLRGVGLDPQDFYTSEPGTLAVDVPVPD